MEVYHVSVREHRTALDWAEEIKYLVDVMKEYAESKGLKVEIATISTVNDIQQAAQSLVGKVDVFYEPTDNIIASAMPTLTAITDPAKKPVICGEPNMCCAAISPAL